MDLPVDSVLPLLTEALRRFAFFRTSFGLMARPKMPKGLLYTRPLPTAIAPVPETRALIWLAAFLSVTLKDAGNVIILIKEVRALALHRRNGKSKLKRRAIEVLMLDLI